MKTQINQLIFFAFFVLISFTACQDEVININDTNEQETIVPNSTLANLIANTSANFGAYDNIIDESSCFSVELPVTIIVSDITITIETISDFDQLEDIFEELADNEDFLDFVFPITIIFNDYTEVVIVNQEQLENFISQCDDDDEVINCVDFVYPISFSVFNSEFTIIDTVIIETDEALYNFLANLEANDNTLIVSLNYPVNLEYASGEIVEVNSNQELSDVISAAEENCDDSEQSECNEDDVAELLLQCPWDINDPNDDFDIHQILFFEDGSITITEGDATSAIGGNWNLVVTNNGLVLNIFDLTAYQEDLGGEWLLVSCNENELDIVRGDYALQLEQDCEEDIDCSVTDIDDILEECAWLLETDLIDTFTPVYVYFTDNGQILLQNGDGSESQIGIWELMVISGDVYLNLLFQDDFEVLNGQWQIVECSGEYLYLVIDDNYIELQRECDLNLGNEVFDCFSDFQIIECLGPNNQAEFNLSGDTIGLLDCPYSLIASFHENILDAETNSNPIVNTESYWSVEAQVFLRIEADNGNFELFTIYLITEDCNLFECFESFDAVLELCDVNNDATEEFNLPIAFSNCIPTADLVSYHETETDAFAGENAIGNPEAYNNISAPQTIFVRVEIDNQVEVFTIDLILADCNAGNCTEEDVDGTLAECIWNITSFNGSDNLSVWNLDFELGTDVLIIYTDTETIDAVWTTTATTNGIVISFSEVNGPNIQEITGSWLVVECTGEQLVLHDINNNNNEMVLDRTCD
ncbi:MAG: hypothetical protein HKN40_13410 [Winogradskyella sp.]|uniref:hypothetical protein n=1 Tax=Winogradskyella sp. TaxID=1883156 RepID=UPI0017CDBA8D|nr:hypothetical protein [Winogradskyella sp.]